MPQQPNWASAEGIDEDELGPALSLITSLEHPQTMTTQSQLESSDSIRLHPTRRRRGRTPLRIGILRRRHHHRLGTWWKMASNTACRAPESSAPQPPDAGSLLLCSPELEELLHRDSVIGERANLSSTQRLRSGNARKKALHASSSKTSSQPW